MAMDAGPPRPRRARADAETKTEIILVKYSAALHATYQVRTLAERAQKEGKQLVLLVPRGFRPTNSLHLLIANNPEVIRIERR
jgi:hypothetical protein